MVDQEKIHNQCLSDDPQERINALEELNNIFSLIPDKQQAWNDLHRLTNDKDSNVRYWAAFALGSAFSYVPDKQQAWNDLHRLTSDKDSDVRSSVAEALGSAFPQMPDKQQAWNDLLRLTNDENSSVRKNVAEALGSAFPQVPDKQQAWNDLFRLTNDEDDDVRSSVAEALGSAFPQMPDKQQAWNDLLRLTNDEHWGVRRSAANALGSAFPQVPDKQQAWNILHRLTNDEHWGVRRSAANALGSAFPQVPDQQQVWNDLLRLTSDEDWSVRSNVAEALVSAFPQIPDKQQAWNDLHKLVNDEDHLVRSSVAEALVSAFPQVPDKQQAWDDLLRLTNDEDWSVRVIAIKALGYMFSQVPDIQQTWNDLHRLVNDEDHLVRSKVAEALGSAFPQVPDKQQAWNDLHKLVNDEDHLVRSSVAEALGSAFPQVPDKQQAWNDLLRLTNDEDWSVRFIAIDALGYVFSQVPDIQQAWNILHRLTNDEDDDVRYSAAKALGSAFPQVPDKKQAWNDLLRLINDEESSVRSNAAEALVSAFSQVPDKQQVWNILHRLTSDKDSDVRSSSNHSLGRVSIFMASQAETDEDYKRELEKAIEFFEIAAKEDSYYDHPAQFCLPFYRSFHTIIFKKQEARDEVDKYLEDTKAAIESSVSKKQLFEAVQNLSEALKQVQSMGNLDLSGMKDELNFYRRYCDHAAELMKCTEEKAPFATEVLRKGLPILDRNLKELLEEIKEKAKTACKVSQGTTIEEIACAVNREVQKWEIGNQEEMERYVENLIFSLKSKIPNIPENKNIYDRIDSLKNEKDLTRQYEILPILISLIPQIIPEIRGTVKNAGGSMGTRENVSKTNSITNKKVDVLLVTVTKVESKAVLDIFQKTTGEEPHLVPIGDQIYHNIGSVNGKSVFLVQSEMGSGGLGASLLTVQKAITDLSPNEVIMIGIAFGIDPEKQSIGDVLVSKQLMLYELQRVGTKDGSSKIIPRGDKAPASTRLLSYFRSVEVRWDESKCKISFGLILSGEKLVDNIDFRQQLCDFYPEAIGGEMEGAGLYVACHDKKVDWIIVKAICDWADGKKSENKEVKQELAAKNAASFVLHALQLVSFTGKLQEHENVSGIESLKINEDKLYNIQKSEKIKDTAKAIDLKFAKFSGKKYQELVKWFKDESKSTLKLNFINPLYSQNDIDFVFHYDISKFDYNLSSKILQFFEDLSEAENARIYIQNNCKNLDPQIQTLCTLEYQNMEFLVISCINKVAEIRSQLKDIYEKSE